MRIAGFVHEEEAIDVQFVKNVAELGQWVRIVIASDSLRDEEPAGLLGTATHELATADGVAAYE